MLTVVDNCLVLKKLAAYIYFGILGTKGRLGRGDIVLKYISCA